MSSAANIAFSSKPSLKKSCILLLLLINCITYSYGQDPSTQVPSYAWIGDADLPDVTVDDLNAEDITIAIAVDSKGFVYTLSFGNGVDKRDSDGNVITKIISPNQLNSPLDIAINSEDLIFIADYSQSGSCSDNGKVKVFGQNGQQISSRTILTNFYRPIGLDIDSDDNVYVAEYNEANSGCENDELSRLRVYKTDGTIVTNDVNPEQPFRVAVDSRKNVFLSQGNGQVLMFNENLVLIKSLNNLQSPAGLAVDSFDFLHVLEYANRVDFEDFINYDELTAGDLISIAGDIRDGIRNEDFIIKIFDQNQVYRSFLVDKIDFPFDLDFNECDRLFVNNSNVEGINFFGFIPTAIRFELEIYQRTPAFDITDPVITCPVDINIQAEPGNNFAVVNYNDPTATDVCGVTITREGQESGTQFTVGSHAVKFTATDSFGNSASCVLSIMVEAAEVTNQAPTAVPDSYSVTENQSFTEPTPGVLSNDTDPENDNLTAVLQTDVSNGILTLNANGSFTYTPNADYVGQDSFTYLANDGQLDSNIVTVTITVDPEPNQAPTAVPDSYSVTENQSFTEPAPGVLINDTDPENDNLTAVLHTDVSNGTLTLNTDGSFTYTPNADYVGQDSFTYLANDGQLDSNIVTVTITVDAEPNQAPTAVPDSYSVTENQSLTEPAPGVLSNDTDPENDNLTAVLQTDVSNGTLTLNADGSFTYTPNPDYVGQDSFTYLANDGQLDSNTVTVTITVDPEPNQAPTAVPDSYSVTENQSFTEPAPGVLSNDTDPENDNLTAVLQTDVSNGTLTLNTDGSFTYTPNADYVGQDSFTYLANDGQLDSNTVTVTITVDAEPNQAPTAVPDSYSVTEDQSLIEPAPGVLSNDTDPENDNLTAVLQTDVSNGTLTLNTDGSFTYTPNTDYVGQDSFTYLANDGQLDSNTVTVTITVDAEPNQAPTAVPESYSVTENQSFTEPAPGVLSNDTDPENDNLTAVLQTDVSNGTLTLNTDGSFTYIPNTDYVGQDSFTYLANDGQLDSNIVTVTINIESTNNNPPEAICLNLEVFLDANGEVVITPEMVSAGNEDMALALDKTVFTCADLGENTVKLTVTDPDTGLSDSCTATLVVMDDINPEITNCANSNREITIAQGSTWELPDYREEFEITDNCVEGLLITQEPPQGTQINSSTDIIVTATDEAGNKRSCIFTVTVIFIDEDELALNCPGEYEIYPNENCEYIVPQFSEIVDFSPAEAQISQSIEAGSVLDLNSDPYINITASFNNQSENCEIYLIPVSKPEISCPGDKMLSLAGSEQISLPDYTSEAEVSGNCSEVEVEQQPAPGTLISNDTKITLTTTDASGYSATCEFFVNIVEDDELIINCPADKFVAAGADCTFTLLDYTSEAELINGENAQVSQLPAPGTIINTLSTEIVLTANDGNSSDSCSFTIFMEDETPPILDLKEINVAVSINGLAAISFEDLDNGSSDNCSGEITYILSKNTFSCKELGQNLVEVTAIDANDNSTTRTTIVTVTDDLGYCNGEGLGSEYIFIYPNPNIGSFKIAAPAEESIERIEVFDHRGRFITAKNYDSSVVIYSIDLGPLQEAVYVIKIITSQRTLTKQFIFKY